MNSKDKILEALKNTPGISARDISKKIHVDKKQINSLLYGKLKHFVKADGEYKWHLIDNNMDVTATEVIAAEMVNNGSKYIIQDGDIDGDAFFSVRPKGGKIVIILNINHPVYPKLIELLEKEEETKQGSDTLDALKFIIMGWAHFEDQQPNGKQKNRASEARADWGRVVKRFLEDDNIAKKERVSKQQSDFEIESLDSNNRPDTTFKKILKLFKL